VSDAIGKIGSSIGGAFNKNPLSFITTGAGALSNFLKSRQQSKYLQDQLNYQKFLRSLTSDPAKMSKYIAGFEKPLSQGLVSAVGNEAQAFGAERGLSTSPQLMAQIESQALAPYQMQEQQQAITAALQSLGMPSGTPSFDSGGGVDLTALLKMLESGGDGKPVIPLNTSGPSRIPQQDDNTSTPDPFAIMNFDPATLDSILMGA
jgi:hypothetical protein